MANEWRRASAQKRGGGQTHLPMDTAFAESRYAADASSDLRAEDIFEQQWALTLLELTLQHLQMEFEAAGKTNDFEEMKSCLMADAAWRFTVCENGSGKSIARKFLKRSPKRPISMENCGIWPRHSRGNEGEPSDGCPQMRIFANVLCSRRLALFAVRDTKWRNGERGLLQVTALDVANSEFQKTCGMNNDGMQSACDDPVRIPQNFIRFF